MNIFLLDRDTVKCAQAHCDKHVLKMVIETAQMLSTAHHVLGTDMDTLNQIYKTTHVKHPSQVWVRSGEAEYTWTFSLFRALCAEYTHRYGRVHATSRLLVPLQWLPKNIESNKRSILIDAFINPPQCMPDQYKRANTVDAYRAYYIGAKSHLLAYTKRDKPSWMS